MKTQKLLAQLLARPTNNTQVAFGLIAGLAVGAALAVLFAPERGLKADLLSTAKDQEKDAINEQPQINKPQTGLKKPKSDIRELVHAAHAATSSPA